MKKVVEREKNKNYYRVLHVPIWIWVSGFSLAILRLIFTPMALTAAIGSGWQS